MRAAAPHPGVTAFDWLHLVNRARHSTESADPRRDPEGLFGGPVDQANEIARFRITLSALDDVLQVNPIRSPALYYNGTSL
jgi:hypothetical protein